MRGKCVKETMAGWLAALFALGVLAGCAGPAQGTSSSAAVAESAAATIPARAQDGPWYHFSIDDVLQVFIDLTDNADVYDSAFDQPLLGRLRALHRQYGLAVSLYCFYETWDGLFNLDMATGRFAAELAENAHWLRFGFHARNLNTTYAGLSSHKAAGDYAACVAALTRIAGGIASIDRLPRLHWFSGDGTTLAAMRDAENGLVGLICGWNTGDANYYLSEAQQAALFANDRLCDEGLLFVPTDLWLEDVHDLEVLLADLLTGEARHRGCALVAFTHEYLMEDADILAKVERCAAFAAENGYAFAFPQDRYFDEGGALIWEART